jgi:hypothetical protein
LEITFCPEKKCPKEKISPEEIPVPIYKPFPWKREGYAL